jgi:lysophospholipase L1-like esterase
MADHIERVMSHSKQSKQKNGAALVWAVSTSNYSHQLTRIIVLLINVLLICNVAIPQVKEKDKRPKPPIRTNFPNPPLAKSKPNLTQAIPQCLPSSTTSSDLGIENTGALAKFFRALAATRAGRRIDPIRIMHYGDSHTAKNILTAEIKRSFQRDFGDGGAGYMIPRNPESTPRRGVLTGATSGWRVDGVGQQGATDNFLGLAGLSLSTDSAGESAWVQTTFKRFEVYFLKQPGGGAIDILVDGKSALDKPISLQADAPTPDYYASEASIDNVHRIEVRTVRSGRARISGIVTEHLSPGVTYDVLGINGARATRLRGWVNETSFLYNVELRQPDLIILAYGTNEVTDDDWSVESYQRMFAEIIRRLRAVAPQASVLVYGPPDRADNQTAIVKMPALIQAQRNAAIVAGAAFWNSSNAMGGPCSMNLWVLMGLGSNDRVFLTNDGYIKAAGIFYDNLMKAFRNNGQ